MSIASILGPDGAIARRLAHYETRPQQLDMAEAVADAIAGGQQLMVEAGTGVGKSFRLPRPRHPGRRRPSKDCRVVVSTHTISLQEQLVHKDIPFLQKVMPQPFTAVLVKGRSNYLSLRRLARPSSAPAPVRSSRGPASSCSRSAAGRGRRRTAAAATSASSRCRPSGTSSRATAATVWAAPAPTTPSASTSRPASRCSAARSLVVNHALFFSDLALRRQGGSLLPDYKVVIFDEAHTLEDVAADHLGLQVGRGGVEYLLNKLYNPRQQRGLLT